MAVTSKASGSDGSSGKNRLVPRPSVVELIGSIAMDYFLRAATACLHDDCKACVSPLIELNVRTPVFILVITNRNPVFLMCLCRHVCGVARFTLYRYISAP